MAFQITSSAAQELVAAAARSDAAGMALRIAARSTPDGLEYGMGFDEAAPDDQVLVFGELTVLLAAASQPWLAATVLDFVEVDPGRADFVFAEQQPAAGGCPPTSCGSGGGCSRCGG
jgi:iron-sulfur cluster assembly protein